MADKTTTLKTKAGDNVFPNVIEKNIPDSIARQSAVDKIQNDLETKYLTKAGASSTYQAKADMESYVTKTYGNAHYATAAQLANKQDKLTAGTGIAIDDSNNTISSTISVPDNIILYGELTPVA